jgi:hypothetical protein
MLSLEMTLQNLKLKGYDWDYVKTYKGVYRVATSDFERARFVSFGGGLVLWCCGECADLADSSWAKYTFDDADENVTLVIK